MNEYNKIKIDSQVLRTNKWLPMGQGVRRQAK